MKNTYNPRDPAYCKNRAPCLSLFPAKLMSIWAKCSQEPLLASGEAWAKRSLFSLQKTIKKESLLDGPHIEVQQHLCISKLIPKVRIDTPVAIYLWPPTNSRKAKEVRITKAWNLTKTEFRRSKRKSTKSNCTTKFISMWKWKKENITIERCSTAFFLK